MSNIINSNAYIKQGEKVYKVNGGAGSPIHTFNTVDEMNAANLADGSIACVPSAGGGGEKGIDLTQYAFDDGSTFNDTILGLFNSFGGSVTKAAGGAFWADLKKAKNMKFVIDASAVANGYTIESEEKSVTKVSGEIVAIEISFLVAIAEPARVTVILGEYGDNTNIIVVVEPLSVPGLG